MRIIETALTPLQREVARQIIDHLKDGGATAGTRVTAKDMAARLGVSRSPVAHAMQMLAAAGLLRATGPRKLEVTEALFATETATLIAASPLEALYAEVMQDRARGALPAEVSETELMARYAMARGTIRKLLMRFAADGLAHRLQGHGWRLADALPDAAALRASYEFRIIIECGAFQLPGYAADPAKLAAQREAHLRMMERDLSTVTAAEWLHMNAGFHETLVSFANNPHLTAAIQQQNNLRRLREAAIYPELPHARLTYSCRDHLAILEAIGNGQLAYAEALMRNHLRVSINL